MHQVFDVVLNHTENRRLACSEDVERLCSELTNQIAFVVLVTPEEEFHPSLTVYVSSGRAGVDYLDLERGIKLGSRDESCLKRGIVSFYDKAYPDLQLDGIEIQCRDVITPDRALAILRHYLNTGEPIDLVPWPSDDYDYWSGDREENTGPSAPDIPF